MHHTEICIFFCPQITIKHNNKLHAYNKYVLTAKVSLISKISYWSEKNSSFLTFTYPI